MSNRNLAEPEFVVRTVSVIMAAVVGLTFLFGFCNVLTLALRLGVPGWVAPLVAPAVDLTVVGLLVGTRHLATHGAAPAQLRPARRLLIFSSVVALALNTAEPIIAGQFGKAAFDAVGPLLLIGWAEVGPDLLASIATTAPCQLSEPRTQHQPKPGEATSKPAHDDASTESGSIEHIELRRTPHADLLAQARHDSITGRNVSVRSRPKHSANDSTSAHEHHGSWSRPCAPSTTSGLDLRPNTSTHDGADTKCAFEPPGRLAQDAHGSRIRPASPGSSLGQLLSDGETAGH